MSEAVLQAAVGRNGDDGNGGDDDGGDGDGDGGDGGDDGGDGGDSGDDDGGDDGGDGGDGDDGDDGGDGAALHRAAVSVAVRARRVSRAGSTVNSSWLHTPSAEAIRHAVSGRAPRRPRASIDMNAWETWACSASFRWDRPLRYSNSVKRSVSRSCMALPSTETLLCAYRKIITVIVTTATDRQVAGR
nr:hypothetical protein [Streptomyces sp. FIT100]